ncbi:Protocadherin Fat 4 [Eumeta japonica]|uniref:Protocadherin Fat 4 n=1 Tax=Eumeta variegata TaxID=151549 RepID=A0A4C1YYI1_EUMVA|nr:Protocadherin Fat 4 [Eumeta japonica]
MTRRELSDPGPTSCVYNVTDADGAISTQHMTFRIDSDRGDDQVFDISSQLLPDEPRRMLMTLVLNSALNFEHNPLHIFSVTALDSLPNTHTVSLMVQVQNVEHRPPRWLEIWAVQRFDEKTNQSFTVRAIDGDTGIDRPILYRLNNPHAYPFFSIETLDGGRGGGIFHVSEIDRDELQQEIFNLAIIAYKDGNEQFWTEAEVTIIVDDVNDNMPTPLHDVYNITIPEETPLTLNFGDDFGFIDRDLGVHLGVCA